jgi:WD40 repeat protein
LPEAIEALHRAVTASRIERSFAGVGGALDWSPRGVFVTEGQETTGIVDIRDVVTGKPVLPPWKGHDADINDVQFSPDGSLLATVGEDGALKIWDPATGDLLSSVTGPGQVFGPSFSADGSLVSASWPDEGTVRIADPLTGKVTTSIGSVERFPFETALSPDGGSVAVAPGSVPIVTVYDVASGERRFELRGHQYPVSSISWTADGRRIATGAFDSSVRIWDGRTGRLQIELLGHSGTVISVDWSPDGSRLLTSASDGTAKVWEITEAGGRELMSLSGQDTRSGLLAVFSPDGEHVIGGNTAISAVKIWDVGVSGDAEWANVPTDLLAPVDVTFLPDGNVVAPAERGSVAVWDLAVPGRPIRTIGPGSGAPEPVVRIAVNRDGSRVATVRNFSDVGSVWDLRTGDLVFEFGGQDEITGIDWSPGGHLLATDLGGGITVFDATGKRLLALTEPGASGVDTVVVSPDGRRFATAGRGRSPTESNVTIWDAETGHAVRKIPTDTQQFALAFDPSGLSLAAGRGDGFVNVYDVDSGERLLRFPASEGPVDAVAYSPNGTTIATAGDDGTVRLFDAEKGTQLLLLPAHRYLVTGLGFNSDGTRLVSASPDGLVRVWALDLDDLIRIAKQELTRELSDDECRQYLHQTNGCA